VLYNKNKYDRYRYTEFTWDKGLPVEVDNTPLPSVYSMGSLSLRRSCNFIADKIFEPSTIRKEFTRAPTFNKSTQIVTGSQKPNLWETYKYGEEKYGDYKHHIFINNILIDADEVNILLGNLNISVASTWQSDITSNVHGSSQTYAISVDNYINFLQLLTTNFDLKAHNIWRSDIQVDYASTTGLSDIVPFINQHNAVQPENFLLSLHNGNYNSIPVQAQLPDTLESIWDIIETLGNIAYLPVPSAQWQRMIYGWKYRYQDRHAIYQGRVYTHDVPVDNLGHVAGTEAQGGGTSGAYLPDEDQPVYQYDTNDNNYYSNIGGFRHGELVLRPQQQFNFHYMFMLFDIPTSSSSSAPMNPAPLMELSTYVYQSPYQNTHATHRYGDKYSKDFVEEIIQTFVFGNLTISGQPSTLSGHICDFYQMQNTKQVADNSLMEAHEYTEFINGVLLCKNRMPVEAFKMYLNSVHETNIAPNIVNAAHDITNFLEGLLTDYSQCMHPADVITTFEHIFGMDYSGPAICTEDIKFAEAVLTRKSLTRIDALMIVAETIEEMIPAALTQSFSEIKLLLSALNGQNTPPQPSFIFDSTTIESLDMAKLTHELSCIVLYLAQLTDVTNSHTGYLMTELNQCEDNEYVLPTLAIIKNLFAKIIEFKDSFEFDGHIIDVLNTYKDIPEVQFEPDTVELSVADYNYKRDTRTFKAHEYYVGYLQTAAPNLNEQSAIIKFTVGDFSTTVGYAKNATLLHFGAIEDANDINNDHKALAIECLTAMFNCAKPCLSYPTDLIILDDSSGKDPSIIVIPPISVALAYTIKLEYDYENTQPSDLLLLL